MSSPTKRRTIRGGRRVRPRRRTVGLRARGDHGHLEGLNPRHRRQARGRVQRSTPALSSSLSLPQRRGRRRNPCRVHRRRPAGPITDRRRGDREWHTARGACLGPVAAPQRMGAPVGFPDRVGPRRVPGERRCPSVQHLNAVEWDAARKSSRGPNRLGAPSTCPVATQSNPATSRGTLPVVYPSTCPLGRSRKTTAGR